MLIGILNDLNKNTIYNIYLNNHQGKLIFNVKCIDDEKYYYLNQTEVQNLFSKLFKYEKMYIGKNEEFDIYLDDANNKHYFKNGYENIEEFFKNNGTFALMYKSKKEKKDNYNMPKLFNIRSVKEDLSLVLICSLIGLSSFYLGANIAKFLEINNVNLGTIASEVVSTYHYYNDLDMHEIKNKINNTSGLTEEEKEYLTNEELFIDILNTVDKKRNEELREKLNNIKLVYFTEEELADEKKDNIAGYYNSLTPNYLHIRNKDIEKDTKSHEFVHLLQDNNKYHFIREAVAEMVTEEYYGEKANTYLSEIKYVKILMEIIGPKPIFECCFKGDTSSFENAIKSNLNEQDASELLELFTTNPVYCENITEVYNKIASFLSKMYCTKYSKNTIEDPIIRGLSLATENINRGYFNKKYIEECSYKKSYVYDTIRVDEAVKDGIFDVECFATKIKKITLEEFLNNGGDENDISYGSLSNYIYKDKHIVNSKTNEKFTMKEAIEKGLIFNVDYLEKTIIPNITLEETIKYENTDEYYGDIMIIKENDDNIRSSGCVYFIYNGNEGKIPFIDICLKKELEPISEKFPEQFEDTNIKKDSFKK